MGRELKMKDLELKITSHSILSLRTNVRSLEVLYRFRYSLDVSHLFDMTIQKFLIREAL
jgi:hypothetical protein